MDEQIEFLLLSPFQDIIEKAQIAVDNARTAGDDDMLKAAQSLLKEGERGRKTVDGVAQRQLKTYAENFITALNESREITDPVDELSTLIYDLEDYTEPDSFDAEKFKEYSRAAQKTTMAIVPLMRRMKLEAPAPATTPILMASPSLSTSSGVMRVSSHRSIPSAYTDASDRNRDERINAWASGPGAAVAAAAAAAAAAAQADQLPQMGALSGPDLGWNNGRQQRSSPPPPVPPIPIIPTAQLVNALRFSSGSSPTMMLPSIPEPPTSGYASPPPIPATNPWQIGPRPSVSTITEDDELGNIVNSQTVDDSTGFDDKEDGEGGDIDALDRRRRISSTSRPDSPTIPSPTSPAPDFPLPPVPVNEQSQKQSDRFVVPLPPPPIPRRHDEGSDYWEERRRSSMSPRTPTARYSIMPPSRHTSGPHPQMPPTPHTGQVSSRESRISTATASTVSSTTNGSVFSTDSSHHNATRESALDPISPLGGPVSSSPMDEGLSAQLLASFASGGAQSPPGPAPMFPGLSRPPIPVPKKNSLSRNGGLEVMQSPPPLTIPPVVIDSGLIPVESPTQAARASASGELVLHRTPDCNIGPASAFHLLKGFCEGAKEVQRGERGVRQIKKLSYSGSGAYAAKCTHCLYELQWSEVEKDRQNHPSANYRMHGIAFRLRFLSKSHLPAKQVDDPLYACLFCLQDGHTLEESDATVFFSQGQLFSHLARHPRPLPRVPGVTVIDGEEVPEEFRYNYDLHFTNPQTHSDLAGIRPELDRLPTGIAVDTFRKAHGTLRRPFDSAMPIQFPAGSKIVGIEFPAKYKGEWAVGWFDNIRGPFPVEAVRLEPPPRHEMRAQAPSALKATTRWKWATTSTYKNSDWLKLDKNETVTDIIWSHPDHWCWAGMNSKGKWGYFPQSHIEPNSLKEPSAGSDSASVTSAVSQERVPTFSSNNNSSSGGGGFFSRLRNNSSNNNNNNNNNPPPGARRPMSISSHSTSSSR